MYIESDFAKSPFMRIKISDNSKWTAKNVLEPPIARHNVTIETEKV